MTKDIEEDIDHEAGVEALTMEEDGIGAEKAAMKAIGENVHDLLVHALHQGKRCSMSLSFMAFMMRRLTI